MRHPASLRPALLAAALACAPSLALAQGPATKIFLVDSSDGYGVDACLTNGADCGQAVANAWCRVHDYERAVSFGKATSDAPVMIAGDPVSAACHDDACTGNVAITCTQ